MPIIIPQAQPSKKQEEKAKGCVVWIHALGYEVWNPETNTIHVVTPELRCDCIGYAQYNRCYHVVAVKMYRELHVTAQEAIEELYDL